MQTLHINNAKEFTYSSGPLIEQLLTQIKDFFNKRHIINAPYFSHLWVHYGSQEEFWNVIELVYLIWYICRKIGHDDALKEDYDPLSIIKLTDSDSVLAVTHFIDFSFSIFKKEVKM